MSDEHEATSVGEAIVQVADDAKSYAAAQIALYKAIALARWRVARTGLALGAVAAVFALAAIIALLVGLILSLAPHVGALGATAIVVVGTLAVVGLLSWLAGQRLGAAFGDIE